MSDQMILWLSMLILGLMLHFLKRLSEAGTLTSFKSWVDFWISDIPRSLTSIIGSIIIFVAIVEMKPELMNALTAGAIGYAGNSCAKIINDKVSKIIEKIG